MTQDPTPPSRSLKDSRAILMGCVILMLWLCRASDLLTHWAELVAEKDRTVRLFSLILPAIFVVFGFLAGVFLIWRGYRGTDKPKRDE